MKRVPKITTLKKIRISSNLAQKDLADKVGVAISSIGGFERGDNPVSNELAIKLSKELNCSIERLFRPHKKLKGKWLAR